MGSTSHTQHGAVFREHLRELRARAGMTQRDLAEALGREHGMVARIELGERRVDFVEAFRIFRALGADPAAEAALLMGKFLTVEEPKQGGPEIRIQTTSSQPDQPQTCPSLMERLPVARVES